LSFPRKRESSTAEFANAEGLWIPACAGMTRDVHLKADGPLAVFMERTCS